MDIESTSSVNSERWIKIILRYTRRNENNYFQVILISFGIWAERILVEEKLCFAHRANVQLGEASYREAYTSTSSPTMRRRRHPRGGQKVCHLLSLRAMPSYFEGRASSTTRTTTGSCRFRVVSRVFADGTWRRANDSWLICERRRRKTPTWKTSRKTTGYLDGRDIN